MDYVILQHCLGERGDGRSNLHFSLHSVILRELTTELLSVLTILSRVVFKIDSKNLIFTKTRENYIWPIK